jgi:hypothetical protein
MDNTVMKMNQLNLVRDSLCEYIIGDFYSQLTYKVITVFWVNDKAIIHTCNGQTVIEYGLEPSENIIKRMIEIGVTTPDDNSALSIQIGDWEIIALISENTLHIKQK